jgi:hypothetical protein
MAVKNKGTVPFLFTGIEVRQFALFEDQSVIEEKLTVKSNFGFTCSQESHLIQCIFKYTFQSENAMLIVLEVVVDFDVEPTHFETKLKTKEGIIIPQSFATHIAMATVGTARGILYSRTEGSSLNKYIMPGINVADAIESDIIFPHVDEEINNSENV